MAAIKPCELNPKPDPRSTNISQCWQNHKEPKVIMADFIKLIDQVDEQFSKYREVNNRITSLI